MNENLGIGLMLVMLCEGMMIAFFTIMLMSPDFKWTLLHTVIYGVLMLGLLTGVKIIENVNKTLKKAKHWQEELIELRKLEISRLPDWRIEND